MRWLESIQRKYDQSQLTMIKKFWILNDQFERIVYNKCKMIISETWNQKWFKTFIDISLEFSK